MRFIKKYYLILVFICVVFSACTSIPPEDILYIRMETAIRNFINKNRRPKGDQIAAFAYKDESLKGGVKKLKNGRIFIGQWEISSLPKKGHYTAFIGKRFSNGNYYEGHSLRLEIKQNPNGTCEVISNQPVKKWGNSKEKIENGKANSKSNNRELTAIEKFYKQKVNRYSYAHNAGKLIADTAKEDPEEATKVFEHAIRKLEPFLSRTTVQHDLFYSLGRNSNNLQQCKVYYECLRKIKKPSRMLISNFYKKLQNITGKRYYDDLNKSKKPLVTVKIQLKEYENIFKNSNLTITYNSLYFLNELNTKQLQELIRDRDLLKTKSKLSSQINVLLQARLEMKKNYKLSPETVTRMWTNVKVLPEIWKIVLGFKIMHIRGGEQIAQFLVKPTLVALRRGDNQIYSTCVISLIARLILIKDDAVIKKVAPQLINYQMQKINKWNNYWFKIHRTFLADFLLFVYRAGNKQVIKKMLDNPKIAQYPDIYITLANLGAENLIKTYLDKNWQHLAFPPITKLSSRGIACSEKVCKEIKYPEKSYIVRTLFAGAPLYYKDRTGKINHKIIRVQSAALNKLAEEFRNIKFKEEQRKVFCLSILLQHRQQNPWQVIKLAEKASTEILAISLDEIFKSEYALLPSLIGGFYITSLRHGHGKIVIAKINKLIKVYKSAKLKTKARDVLESGCADAFGSLPLESIKIGQLKEFACVGRLVFTSGAVRWHGCPLLVVWLNYLAREQKEFITAMKNIKDKRNQIDLTNWRSQMNRFKTYCEKNKLDAKKEIIGFLNSPLMEEGCKKKSKELKAMKKYMLDIFEK